MSAFLHKTRGDSDPKGKPRVVFTCHPADFKKHFKKICEDIFKTHDCVIYHTKDLNETIEDKYKESDLGQINLLVIPVTFKLLSEPNRALDSDFLYAKKRGIPILPIMMESGINEFYSRPDKFGELQYLNPYSRDLTEISYEEKLKKYLESVLISDKLAARIRAAFDAYIFLSYRKKDRHYANELMKLIHKHPKFRDIAIWYDEFLTPGESFQNNILKIIKDSKLFTLLVTPNLLERIDGKPNYIMAHEYPDAKKAEIDILPTEMEETDKELLAKEFNGIPDCINPNDDESFKARLSETLSKIAISKNNDDPEHNFLIGLAYLNGIDVEINKERGIALITSAAEAGFIEAMEKLYLMYSEGIGVRIDYNKALKLSKEIYIWYYKKSGSKHPDTLSSLNNIAYIYNNLGYPHSASNLFKKVYLLRHKVSGATAKETLIALNNLACTYSDCQKFKEALNLHKKIYNSRYLTLGDTHIDTIISLNNLAFAYTDIEDYTQALKLFKKEYTLTRKVLGKTHPYTLIASEGLAETFFSLGNYAQALKFFKNTYALSCKVLGEEHTDTIIALNNLALTYGTLGNHKKELNLFKKGYILSCRVLGKNHPDTLISLSNLSSTYNNLGRYAKALKLSKKAYVLKYKILGKEHPSTLLALGNLAFTYEKLGNYAKALDLHEKEYALSCKILKEEHPDTLLALNNLASTHFNLKNYNKALELFKKLYFIKVRLLGATHPEALEALKTINAIKRKTINNSL